MKKKPFQRRKYTRSTLYKTSRRGAIGPPMHWKGALLYSENITSSNLVGGAFQFVWALNDLRKPSYTTLGHQPYGHDQLATMYTSYSVIGCKVDVDHLNQQSTGSLVTLYPCGDDPTYVPFTGALQTNQYVEWPQATTRICGGTEGATNRVKFSRYFDVRKQVVKGYTENNNTADFGVSPAKVVYVAFRTMDSDDPTLQTIGSTSVKLTYYLKARRMAAIPQS